VTVDTAERFDVAVVGAGFAALALAHRLAESGIDDVVIFERSEGVGGTWRANTYPGAACDVPSHLYSLSFAPNPDWSRSYASRAEILEYIEACYDRFDVRRKVRCSTPIVAIAWQEDRHCWRLRDATDTEYEAAVVVSAVGLFHTPAVPELPGLGEFGGTWFHSARWDHEHDLTGRRVAVIGTGASAIQVVPAIADRVAHLDLYQRTPAWIVARNDVPYTDAQRAEFADRPEEAVRHRNELYQFFEQNTAFILGDPVVGFIEGRARDLLAEQVGDPQLRSTLTPSYPIGVKRILVSSNFYPALQRDNVELVTDAIREVVPTGIVTCDGTERPCDTIVLCTGFQTTDFLIGLRVVGRDGLDIQKWWDGVPRAYHGLVIPGFPNFFMMYGPNTNQGGNSIILMLEAQAQFIADALETLRSTRTTAIEVRTDAMDRYQSELRAALDDTVWALAYDSYFRTAAGDIVTQAPYTTSAYAEQTRHIRTSDFTLRTNLDEDSTRRMECTTS
jgi:cation diffusion facilitator CzcD-associated flavoprotein CzcO